MNGIETSCVGHKDKTDYKDEVRDLAGWSVWSQNMLNVFMLINVQLPWDQQIFAWQSLADEIS